jgi:hypothetical protein
MMASDAVLDVDDGCPFYSNLARCWRWLAFSMYMDGNSVYFAVWVEFAFICCGLILRICWDTLAFLRCHVSLYSYSFGFCCCCCDGSSLNCRHQRYF